MLLFVTAALFTACKKDNVDEIIIKNPIYEPGEVEVNSLLNALAADNPSGAATLNCVTLQYPFQLKLKSGGTATINTKSDLEAATGQNVADPAVNFVFPLNATNGRGETVQFNTNRELGREYASCLPQVGWAAAISTNETLPACWLGGLFCFDLVYPINLEDEAGNTYVVENEDEFLDLFASEVGALSFLLPISVEDQDGVVTLIENMDDFFSVAAGCDNVNPVIVGDNFEFQGFACYELAYPLDMFDGNGNQITVANADEYATLVLGGEALNIQYPFSLVNDAGETVTISNDFDYIAAINACGLIVIEIDTTGPCAIPSHVQLFFNRGGPAMSPCRYEINYPLQLQAGGNTYTINQYLDYFPVYNAYQLNEIEVVYPVSVTVISTGQTIVFASDNDVCAYAEDCE